MKRYHERPAEELYDLTSDPNELKNLALDSKHSARLAAMRADVDVLDEGAGRHGPDL